MMSDHTDLQDRLFYSFNLDDRDRQIEPALSCAQIGNIGQLGSITHRPSAVNWHRSPLGAMIDE